MKKILHIAKANVLKHKGAVISLFVIIMIVSALSTIALSVLLEVEKDYYAGLDRLNSLHSLFFLPREKFEPSFEPSFKNDPRVTEYEITEALSAGFAKIKYGGEINWNVIIMNLSTPLRISAPKITEINPDIPIEYAVYLPRTAKNVGYKTGDLFTIEYMNKPVDFIVAGFFETNELSVSNHIALKFFVSNECYQRLSRQFMQYTWAAIRFDDPLYSVEFNKTFVDENGLSSFTGLSGINIAMDIRMSAESNIIPIMVLCAIIIVFTLLITLIMLIVIRFRVTNNIYDTMHEIGVLKASGYTTKQIVMCYIMEYSIIALPSVIIGSFLPIPFFGFIRTIFGTITGFGWTFSVNFLAGFLVSLIIVIFLLLMVQFSCSRIKRLPPVEALRGGIASNNFRRNWFRLDKGMGNIHIRLGLKNMFAHLKSNAMIGVIITGISIAVTITFTIYYNFVIDQNALIKMTGIEISDLSLSVMRHTDADVFAAELEKLPEVRKTSMMEIGQFSVNGYDVMSMMSNDYSLMEIITAHDGRLPKYDNEIVFPKRFADMLGKRIGDHVTVRANGVSQEFILTGHFSTTNNGGQIAAITLEGYQRLDPNAKRNDINIYLHDDVDYDAFIDKLERIYGVLNKYRQEENSSFAAAKARAEEKISIYLENYAIDSIEYAVLYNGQIILSGSSNAYQIKSIVNMRELVKAQVGSFEGSITAVMQLISLVSLIILSLILYMTVRGIVARRRRELGTLKSCGFTTKQLARQLAVSFMPLAGIGVVIGCTLGALLANPAIVVMLSSMGVYNASITVLPAAVVLIGAISLFVTYTMANISAMRIKHISVYELLSE